MTVSDSQDNSLLISAPCAHSLTLDDFQSRVRSTLRLFIASCQVGLIKVHESTLDRGIWLVLAIPWVAMQCELPYLSFRLTQLLNSLLLQHIYPLINFASLLIVEPMLSSIGPQALGGLRNYLIDSAIRRNDTWSDRATALRSLKQKKRTGKWDPRVLELFVVCGVVT